MWPKQHNLGFSLIELLLVIILAAILITVAAARWPGGEITLQAYAENLSTDIDLARTAALSRGTGTVIQRGSSADSYSISSSSGSQLYPTKILPGASLEPFRINFDRFGNPGADNQDISIEFSGVSKSLQVVGESGAVIWL